MEREEPLIGPLRYEELVPPPDEASVRRTALMGVALAGVAALLGLGATALGDATPWPVATARLWAVGLGAVVAGYAVSRRAGSPAVWLLAAAAALVGVVGIPGHWDSIRLLFRALAGVALAGAGIAALPAIWRYRVVSALLAFHFFGIFMATTSPSPSTWVTDQIFNRVYSPYLQFVYLRNAYHFYSPEPGPASLLCFLVKTRTGEKEIDGVKQPTYDRRWVVVPLHPQDVKDPLGVSYFRRLSLTEAASQGIPGGTASMAEGGDIFVRRHMFARYKDDVGREVPIPTHPFELIGSQYQLPLPHISRYILPSYARHAIYEACPDQETMARTTVSIYRTTHRTLTAPEVHAGVAPFAPSQYRPYYLGEYDVAGRLLDPRDPMLYWLVPVYPKGGGLATDPNPAQYDDYLSKHAGLPFDWSSLR